MNRVARPWPRHFPPMQDPQPSSSDPKAASTRRNAPPSAPILRLFLFPSARAYCPPKLPPFRLPPSGWRSEGTGGVQLNLDREKNKTTNFHNKNHFIGPRKERR